MNEAFLNEVWGHVTASLYAIEYWGEYKYRSGNCEIVDIWEHNEESDGVRVGPYALDRERLKKDLKAMYDLATKRVFADSSYVQDWSNNFVAGIATQDISEWDDEVVDVFIQLATLGEITYG